MRKVVRQDPVKITFLLSKFLKKIQIATVLNCKLEKPCKIYAKSTVIESKIGRYSYCSYGCTLIRCRIGRYCSIAEDVSIGLAGHPMTWVSTSPAFYDGRSKNIKKDIAALPDPIDVEVTEVGNDVWIGNGAWIKAGVHIGDGAVIGMGSVVTHDVPPYAVVAGNPAKMIRMRFSEDLIRRLQASAWWELEPEKLKKVAAYMNRPEEFLKKLEQIR